MTMTISDLNKEGIKNIGTVELYKAYSNWSLERERQHIKMDAAYTADDIAQLLVLGGECGVIDVYLSLMEAELHDREGMEHSQDVLDEVRNIELEHTIEAHFIKLGLHDV